MRIDIVPRESWFEACDQYRAELPFQDSAVQVQLYRGYQHALWEVTQGLAKLFSHKQTVAIASALEPALESVAMAFSENSINVKLLGAGELADPATWLESVQKDLLFVLVSDDDPVTGRIHETSSLWSALADKRIFRIHLSHASFRNQPLSRPLPFEVQILSLERDRALVIAGERLRIAAPTAQSMSWPPDDPREIKKLLRGPADGEQVESIDDARTRIEAWEKNLPAGFQPYFGAGENRCWDRVAFYHPELDGAAVMKALAERLGLKLKGIAEDRVELETTSGCRWNSQRFADWLLARGEGEAVIRGLVLLSCEHARPETLDHLDAVAREILAIQYGN